MMEREGMKGLLPKLFFWKNRLKNRGVKPLLQFYRLESL